jgi:4,5-DOPA dioxygenase extradiol
MDHDGKLMPVLFIGHGSPMNIILDNDFTRSLKTLGTRIPRPNVILIISAHWLTQGTYVTCQEYPQQIYDFYGFPDELYRIHYCPEGSKQTADRIIQESEKLKIRPSIDWGLDHASWAVLKHMYPSADIPVLELSLNRNLTPNEHFKLAAELAYLRSNRVLIIGSGNIVHNLRIMNDDMYGPAIPWAKEFDETIGNYLINHEIEKLIRYDTINYSNLAVPTNDHYIPLLYVLGLSHSDEALHFVHESIQHGSISMRSFRVG